MSFVFENYNIMLQETEFDVIIRIVDNKSLKVYECTNNKMKIQNIGDGNITDFYISCFGCFESLSKNGINTDSIDIGHVTLFKLDESFICIAMNHGSNIIINLDIPLIDENQVLDKVETTNQININKLIDELKECKNRITALEQHNMTYRDLLTRLDYYCGQ
jgi:hypothetical protein